jgi:hypothetical protein
LDVCRHYRTRRTFADAVSPGVLEEQVGCY